MGRAGREERRDGPCSVSCSCKQDMCDVGYWAAGGTAPSPSSVRSRQANISYPERKRAGM